MNAPHDAPDARPSVGDAEPGPRESVTLTCRGCPSFSEENWREPSGDGETYDRGTYHCCSSGLGILTAYGSAAAVAPSNCPCPRRDSRAREKAQADTITDLTEKVERLGVDATTLREFVEGNPRAWVSRALTAECALATAQERIAEMEAGLRPFAFAADCADGYRSKMRSKPLRDDAPTLHPFVPTIGDFRRARALLHPEPRHD